MPDLVGGLWLVSGTEQLRLSNSADEAATAVQFEVDAAGALTVTPVSGSPIVFGCGLDVNGNVDFEMGADVQNDLVVHGLSALGASAVNTAAWLKLGLGSASVVPLLFGAGTLKTSAIDGAVEYDGASYYGTVGTDRQKLLRATDTIPYTSLTYSGLTTGTVLRATGATSAAFGAVDLANASAITGNLPYANLPSGGSTWANGGDLLMTGGKLTVGSVVPTGASAMLIGVNDGSHTSTLATYQFNSNASWRAFRARGSVGSPTQTQAGDTLWGVTGIGFGTAYGSPSTQILMVQSEAYVDPGNRGGYIAFNHTLTGSGSIQTYHVMREGHFAVTTQKRLLFDNDGTGIVTGDTYMTESANNVLDVWVGGTLMGQFDNANANKGVFFPGSGNVFRIGTGSFRTDLPNTDNVQIEGSDGPSTRLALIRNSADALSPYIEFAKTRGATNGSKGAVADGDDLGGLLFAASTDGSSALSYAGALYFRNVGTPSAGSMVAKMDVLLRNGASDPTQPTLSVGTTTSFLTSRMGIGMSGTFSAVNPTLQVGPIASTATKYHMLFAAYDGVTPLGYPQLIFNNPGSNFVAIGVSTAGDMVFGTNNSTPAWISQQMSLQQSTGDLFILSGAKLRLDGSFTGDTYLYESSANVLDLYAGGVNTLRLSATALTFAKPATLKSYTVATLPAGVQGFVAYVTDALAPTYLTAVVGGGAVVTPVFYDGTNWVTI